MGHLGVVAELLVQEQCLLEQIEGVAVVSQAAVVPAEVGEREGPADLVAQPLEEVVGAAGGGQGVRLAALGGVDQVAVVVRPRLSGKVTVGSFPLGGVTT